MAYMSQENKKALAPAIQAVLKKYNTKGTIGVDNLSTLVVNVRESKMDLVGTENKNRMSRAFQREIEFYAVDGSFSVSNHGTVESARKVGDDEVANFYDELLNAMNGITTETVNANYNNSDLMTDYHDVGYYITINVGTHKKAFVHTA